MSLFGSTLKSAFPSSSLVKKNCLLDLTWPRCCVLGFNFFFRNIKNRLYWFLSSFNCFNFFCSVHLLLRAYGNRGDNEAYSVHPCFNFRDLLYLLIGKSSTDINISLFFFLSLIIIFPISITSYSNYIMISYTKLHIANCSAEGKIKIYERDAP